MALDTGSKAPDFSLPSTSGSTFKLSKDLLGKPVILYFYPKNFTRVCTQESCSFRDHFDVFRDASIDVFGVSMDNLDSHEKFREQYKLPFHLLADVSGSVSKLYKAKLPFVPMSKRITYLLDSNHIIRAKYNDMFGAESHIKAMIASLN